MAVEALYTKITDLKISEQIEELQATQKTLKGGDIITTMGVGAAALAIAPWLAIGAAITMHATSKSEIEKVAQINAKLREHFNTLIAGVPDQWTIKEFTSSNRIQELVGYLLSLNPSTFVLTKLSVYKASDMDPAFITKVCNPVGIVALEDKLQLTASRNPDESYGAYLSRLYGRTTTEVNRTLYGSDANGGLTTTGSVLQGTRAISQVPFKVVGTAVETTASVAFAAYNGVTSAGSFLLRPIFGSAKKDNNEGDDDFKNEDDFNDDDDLDGAKEMELLTIDDQNRNLVTRSSSKSPSKK